MIRLGAFSLLAPIGRGGMGEVWLAQHEASGGRVAIKVLSSTRARDDRYQRAFKREARAIASLDHPNIVDVHHYDVIPEDSARSAGGRLASGTPYMVMDYVGGGTLNNWRRKLEWGQLRAILLSLLDALAHAHARQVIHRDLKPGNVLVGAQAELVQLTDFGLAHAVDREGLTMTSPAAGMGGTPAYMAPEQFVGDPRDVGPWSDLYALGCMIYSLCTGAPPYGRKPWLEVANGHLHKPLPKLVPGMPVPRGFGEWVDRLLEKDSADRYHRAADAAWDLCELDDPTELIPRPGLLPLDDDTTDLGAPFAEAHKTQTTLLWGDQFARSPVGDPVEDVPTLRFISPRMRVPPMPLNWRGPERRYRPPLGTGLFEQSSLPIVGREAEREAIWAALRRVREQRRAEALVLRGGAGVGKSRLAEWACTRADELGAATILRASHSPVNTAQCGIGPMTARWARAVGLDREPTRVRLEGQLEMLGIDDPDLVLPLTELVCPTDMDSGISAIRLAHVAERHELVRRLLLCVARSRPVVAWLDDAQWGVDTLEFASFVLSAGGNVPVLLLLTVRDDGLLAGSAEAAALDELLAHDTAQALELGRLGERDRLKLLTEVLQLSPELAARVDQITDGNPEFAVQLVTDWHRRDALSQTRRGRRLRKGESVQIPDDLHAAWSHAVEEVLETRDAADGVALELAAVMGRQVHSESWRIACEHAGVVPEEGLVDVLLARKLARAQDPDQEWAFQHGMVHESVQRRAREGGRWTAHHTLMAGLYQGARTPVELGRLAHHLAEAGQHDQALEPLKDAICGYVATSEYRAAEASLSELQSVLDRLGVGEEEAGRSWVHVLRARLARLRRNTVEATQEAELAERMARRGKDRGVLLEALMEGARLQTRGGEPDKAVDRLEEAAQLARALGDSLKVAEVESELGTARGRLGETAEAREMFMRAIRTYRSLKRADLAAEVWMGLAELGRSSGRNDLATKWAQEAQRCYAEQGNRWGIAAALNTQADLLRLSGDLDGSERMFRDVLRRYDALGMSSGAVARLNLALVLLARERWEEARAELERYRRAASGSYPLARAVSHAGLAACAAHAAEWSDVARNLQQVLATTEQGVVHDVDLANLLQLAGSLAAASGHKEHARMALELALNQWSALGRNPQASTVRQALKTLP